MSDSRLKNAKRNIIFELTNTVVKNILPFISRTVLIYVLGKTYLGLNSLFTSILQVLSLADLGFGSAIVYNMYKPIAEGDSEKVNALLNLYRKIYRIVGIGILVIGLGLLPFLRRLIKGDIPPDMNLYVLYLINLGNTVISYFLFAYKKSLLSANQRSDIISKIDMIFNGAGNILCTILLLLFKNYYFYCIVFPIMTMGQNLFAEFATRKLFPQYFCRGAVPAEEKKVIKKNVVGVFSYKVSHVFRNSFDSIVISAYLGLDELAYYNNYYFVLNTLTNFISAITNSMIASIGNKLVVSSKEENHKDMFKFLLLYMWITSWCTVCLYCLYQPFITIWVGKGMLFSDSIMIIFCIYFFTRMMNMICYAYRQAAGLWWEDRFRPLLEAFSNLGLNILLVQHIGVTGVMISTVVCLVPFNTIWGSHLLYKKYFTEEKYSRYLLRLGYYSIVAFVGCLVTGWVCSLHTFGNQWINLIYRGAICVVLPNVMFVPMLYVLPEFKSAMAFSKKLIKHK